MKAGIGIFVLIGMCASPLAAQATVGGQFFDATRPNLVGLNPVALLVGWVSGEYEHATSAETSFGFGGTYDAGSKHAFSSFDAKFRVYPGSSSLSGTSVVVTAGYARTRRDLLCIFDCNSNFDEGATIGLGLDHNFTVGSSGRFVLGAGIGAKRMLGGHHDSTRSILPTVRFLAGWAY